MVSIVRKMRRQAMKYDDVGSWLMVIIMLFLTMYLLYMTIF